MSALASHAATSFPLRREGAVETRVSDLMAQGAYAEALKLLLPRLKSGKLDVATLDLAASCYWYLDDSDTALSLVQVIVDQWPDRCAGWTKLAAMATSVGQTERARAALGQALKRGPKSANGLALLNRLDPIRRDSASARRLKALATATQTPARDKATAMNTLGRIEDRAGRPRAAFRWFASAKRAYGEEYRPREVTAMVAAQIVRFDPTGLPDMAEQTPRMLFVVGMPRSGTTLVETILARHSDVRPLGESQALTRTVMAMRQHVAQTANTTSAWDWFEELSPQEVGAFRRLYLSYLPPGAAQGGQMLVSKMPLDCFDLGAARVLLPQARFLLMNRHPLDVGLSNFTTNFHEGNAFSRRLDWTGHMIRSVARSADDYERKLGARFRRQSYRGLIEKPKRQVRAILDHIGLPWQEACLSPEKGHHIVRTASLNQVREAINRKGLDRWKPYQDQLSPLVGALGGWDWIQAWEEADAALAMAPTGARD